MDELSSISDIAARLDAVNPTAPVTSTFDTAEVASRGALSSTVGRQRIEQDRWLQQIEQLEFENCELRRATRAKTQKINALSRAVEDYEQQLSVRGRESSSTLDGTEQVRLPS